MALAAGEIYSIYATFFGHTLRPPNVFVVDQYTHRHLLSGQIGYIKEVFYWTDLIQVVAVSILIFGLVWWGACIVAKFAYKSQSTSVTSTQVIGTDPRSQRIVELIGHSINREVSELG